MSSFMYNFKLIGQCSRIVFKHNSADAKLRALTASVVGSTNLRTVRLSHKKMCETSQHNAKDSIVWVDMEMTGLDIANDQIMEVACIITDPNLNTIAEGPELIIHQPDHILDTMGEWCTDHHKKSGLTDAVRRSKISVQEAEEQILNFLKLYTPSGACPLAGNSVYMDRLFIRHHMPRVDEHLHYRIIDVSTVKELCKRWCPEKYSQAPVKVYGHRALMDIRESITELHYYRTAVFGEN